MKKLEQAIVKAWREGIARTVSNTRTDGRSIFLHGNEIVRRVGRGIQINMAGWPTVTTRSRINAALEGTGWRVYQDRGWQYLHCRGTGEIRQLDESGWVDIPG